MPNEGHGFTVAARKIGYAAFLSVTWLMATVFMAYYRIKQLLRPDGPRSRV